MTRPENCTDQELVKRLNEALEKKESERNDAWGVYAFIVTQEIAKRKAERRRLGLPEGFEDQCPDCLLSTKLLLERVPGKS